MAKDIKFNIEARDAMKQGVDQLANAVKVNREEVWCSADHQGWCDRCQGD